MLQQNGFRRALSGVQRTSRKKLPCELCTSPQNGSLGCEIAAEICASHGFPQFLLLHRLLPCCSCQSRDWKMDFPFRFLHFNCSTRSPRVSFRCLAASALGSRARPRRPGPVSAVMGAAHSNAGFGEKTQT